MTIYSFALCQLCVNSHFERPGHICRQSQEFAQRFQPRSYRSQQMQAWQHNVCLQIMLSLYPFSSRARSPYIWCSERGRFLDIPHSVRRYDYHIHFLTNFNVFSVPDLIKKEMSAMYKLIRSTVYQVPKPWSNLAMACCLSVAAGSGYRCMSALLLLLAEDSQAVCSC